MQSEVGVSPGYAPAALRLPTSVSFNNDSQLEDDLGLSLSSNAIPFTRNAGAGTTDKRNSGPTMDEQVQEFLDGIRDDLQFGGAPLLGEKEEGELEGEVDFVPLPALSESSSPLRPGTLTHRVVWQRARADSESEDESEDEDDIRSSRNPTVSTASPVRKVVPIPKCESRASTTPPTQTLELLEDLRDDVDMVMSPSPIPGLAGTQTSIPLDTSMQVEPPVTRMFENESELANKLNDIRKSIAGHIVKERAILQALTKFGARVPERIESEYVEEDEFIAKIRLELLKDDLENARLKRLAVEKAVRDVVEEGRPPFVCPALMDVFADISRLSTRVLQSE